jgi:hypothetical protein
MKLISLVLLPASLAVACGGNGELTFDQSTSAAVVAGTNAAITAHNVPASLAPGESRMVDITVQNSGSVAWTTTDYALRPATGAGVPFTARMITPTIAPGASATFRVFLTAPAGEGAYTFNARMYLGGRTNSGYFGETLTVPIAVSSQVTGQFHSQLISHNLPAVMAPNERRNVIITMRNIGYDMWTPAQIDLRSNGTVRGTRARPVSNVGTGQNVSFPVALTAPAADGPASFTARLWFADGTLTGNFGVSINIPVTIATPAAYDSDIVSHDIPVDMGSTEQRSINIVVRNSGTQAWTGSNFALVSQNGMWMVSSVALGAAETVAAGASKTFTFSITAPVAPGIYANNWRMANNNVGFGATATQNTRIMILENGSFEDNNYASWHFQSTYEGACSTFGVATDGTVLNGNAAIMDHYENIADYQGSPGLPSTVNATEGTHGAFLLVQCPDEHVMYQDAYVPMCNAHFSMDLGWANHVPFQAGQEIAVEVRNPATDSVLSTLFVTNGATPRNSPISSHSFDVSAFAGQTVRLVLRVNAQQFFIETQFDDFAIGCQ